MSIRSYFRISRGSSRRLKKFAPTLSFVLAILLAGLFWDKPLLGKSVERLVGVMWLVAKCFQLIILPLFSETGHFVRSSSKTLVKLKGKPSFRKSKDQKRWVTINPTLDDIYHWARKEATKYAVDIETLRGQITMIGFARSRSDAIVIPFVNRNMTSYWETHEDEVRAWVMVKEMLETPIPKIFQNGLYDLSYIVPLGFKPQNVTEDTMLLHHSLYPELRKGLDFLGSIYTDEVSWKLMRHRNKEAEKREE